MLLFSDAEVGENVAEDFVGCDFAHYAAKMIDAFAEVLGDKVCGDAVI